MIVSKRAGGLFREALSLLPKVQKLGSTKRLELSQISELPDLYQKVVVHCGELAGGQPDAYWTTMHGLRVEFPMRTKVYFRRKDHVFFASPAIATVVRWVSVGGGTLDVVLTVPSSDDWSAP